MIRVHDNISGGMGTVTAVRSEFHIVWYSLKLDSGKTVQRRGGELRLATCPSQYGLETPVQNPVDHHPILHTDR